MKTINYQLNYTYHYWRKMAEALRFMGLVLIFIGLPACDLEEEPDCSIEARKKFVYDIMSDFYLWADKTPKIDINDYSSPEEVLEAMAFRELDRWSHVSSAEKYKSLIEEAEIVAFGFRMVETASKDFLVQFVEPGSPAEKAGLSRGDMFVTIAGKSIDDIEDQDLWKEVLGPNQAGTEVVFTVSTSDKTEKTLTIKKEKLNLKTVAQTEVLDIMDGEKQVGYIHFTSFFGPSEQELHQAFGKLKKDEIDELILDLRYNSGGLLHVADFLVALIAGKQYEGKVWFHASHNQRYSSLDEKFKVKSQENSLDLSRLIVLTGPASASASEAVINGLMPFMDVTIVGEATSGKPVGSTPLEYCGDIISSITFSVLNGNGEGDYFLGIMPDCKSSDDLGRQLGDPQEAQLETALQILEEGQCPSSVDASSSAALIFRQANWKWRDRPERLLDNLF